MHTLDISLDTSLDIKFKIVNQLYSSICQDKGKMAEITSAICTATHVAHGMQQKKIGQSMGIEWVYKDQMNSDVKSYFSDLTDDKKVLSQVWAYLYDAPCDLVLEKMFDYHPNKKNLFNINKSLFDESIKTTLDIWQISGENWSVLFNTNRIHNYPIESFMGSYYYTGIANVVVYGDLDLFCCDMLMVKLMGWDGI